MKNLALMVLLALAMIAPSLPSYANTQEFLWIEAGKDAVKAKLKDGKSAQFRNVFFNRGNVQGKSIPVACGEVNSKNGFGGYGGFQKFVAMGENIAYLQEEISDFENVWASLCQ